MPPFELDNPTGAVKYVNPNDKPVPYQTTVVDHAYIPRKALLTHVEGMKWELDEYFSQYLAMDDDTESLSVNRLEAYQQYQRILNFEMRVTSPLDVSSDDTSREFQLTGTATMYPGFIPNKGDMFVAGIGDGRKVLFTLTNIQKMSVLLDSVYEVNYESVDYYTDALQENLIAKVIKTTHFVKDFLALGNNPFLVASEYDVLKQLKDWESKLPLEYVREFFNEEYSTLLVPDQIRTTYDPYIVRFVKAVMSTHRESKFSRIKELNCDNSKDSTYTTVFDTLLELNERGLDFVQQYFERYWIRGQHRTTTFGQITYSGIDTIYYPKGNNTLGYVTDDAELQPSAERVFNRPIDLSIIITETKLEGLVAPDMISIDAIKLVTVDKYYVLSKAFYDADPTTMSALELLLTQVYAQKPLCHYTLLSLCTKSVYWGKLERYYYLPLLQFLLVVSKKDVN